jgi:phthiocerol/phenolphthiocerol synthesis type-I polyketide synthase C
LTETSAHRWRASLSLELLPWLTQHRVAGRILLPATAMIEIMHEAARQVLPAAVAPELRDVEFLRPVEVPQAGVVELQTDWEPAARQITLSQLVGEDWVPTAVSRAFSGSPVVDKAARNSGLGGQAVPGFYEGLRAQGLDYGPLFALVDRVELGEAGRACARLIATPPVETGCALDPAAADAGLHAAAVLINRAGVRLTGPMVPARIGRVRMCDSGQIRSADLVLRQATAEGAHLDIELRDEVGRLLARFDEVRLRPLPDAAAKAPDLWEERLYPLAGHTAFDLAGLRAALARLATAEPADVDVLRAALAARVAWDIVADSLAGHEVDDPDGLNLCINWLVAQGYARFADDGLQLLGTCPWPAVETLLPALGQIPDVVSGEFATLLDFVTKGGPSGSKKFSPLPRLQAALQAMIAATKPEGRIALVGPVGRAAVEWLSGRGHAVTLVTPGEESRDAARAEFADFPMLRTAALGAAGLEGSFDLVIAAHVAQAIPSQMLGEIAGLLTPGGCLATLEESADLFSLITGRHHGAAALDTLCGRLKKEGLAAEIQETSVSETVFLVSGRRDITEQRPVRIDVVGQGAWAEVLRALSDPEAKGRLTVVLLDKATDAFGPDLLRVLRALPEGETVWLLDPGTARFEALTGWRRVLVNETGRDLRLCSVSDDADVATLLRVLTVSLETEVRIEGKCAASPRLFPHAAEVRRPSGTQALQLQMPSRSPVAERPVWKPVARQVPKDGEVEIAVEATGLNFRDVMWAQGLIPPEGLEGGFAGQGLGMECAGRVLGIDPSGRFLPGQKVAAFAPNAFATHVTVPVHAVLPLPDELSMIEGAALPVVFLTADYALNELARLSPGETVLIHGGAGGVGLAAIQIARKAGARVFATAGSPARRGYLKMIGADATFDSRSLSFVDEVMESTGGRGVDVVLNSLAGEALELGLSCLAPFGRFVELGKRDIFQNSTIGLRVLKNNISLMAVDVDQLMQHRPQVAEHAIARIAEGFASGNLQPLPVSAFDAFETTEAFRLMLRSGQIGKIVVRPPEIAANAKVSVAPNFGRCWLVTGGTDGFGLATAEWLVRQGVRRLWLTSRSGRLSDEARARLLPAEVQVRAADVSDGTAMAFLADEIESADGRLDGIVHSAGVLRDGLFCDLDDQQILQVATPKVRGAEVLDHVARRLKPGHFWLFSSVSARFGNIGQAPYVAANRALEAIARRRNGEGLPALAIAWGPISDVGMLQRMPEHQETLARTLGTLLTAEQALDRLAKVLSDGFRGPTITIAPMEWGRLAKDVRVLGEPLFEFVPRSEIRANAGLSLPMLVAKHGEAKARKEVLAIIRAEMARILRCAAAEIDPARPMADFGFDSLMAVSLRLAIEEQLGVELSFQALGAETSLNELVHRLFARVAAPEADDLADYMQSVHVTGSPIAEGMLDKILAHADERKS